jgi:glycosyltransferase involved in cell wall biosynthesis
VKKVLFVSYVFPPMGAVGGRRIVGFCKFLPSFGWKPVVLTVKGGTNTSWDHTPVKGLEETSVYRTPVFEPMAKREMRRAGQKESYRLTGQSIEGNAKKSKISFMGRIKRFIRLLLSVPDFAIFWVPLGIFKGLAIIKKEKIDCIVSSSPPVSSHILASVLSRISRRPHLVDFRDLWTLNQNYELRNYPRYFRKYDRFWEKFVLKHADRIMTASPGFTDQMENHLGGFLRGKVSTVTNGFDYSEVDLNEKINCPDREKLKILYTGSLYSNFNPVFFLESVATWIGKHNIDPNKIQIDFIGNSDYDYNELARSLGLSNSVRFHGFMPQSELHSYFRDTDIVLLLLGFRPEYKNVVPAKIFEYLASGKIILALAPDGVTTGIIDKYKAGVYLTTADKEKLGEIFDNLYRKWSTDLPESKSFRYIKEIDRKELTGELARILEKLISENKSGAVTKGR